MNAVSSPMEVKEQRRVP